jgi:hypothetical protein
MFFNILSSHLQFKSVLTSSAIDEDSSPQNSFTADSDLIAAAAVNLSMLASHIEQPRGCDLALESHISVVNLVTESTAVEEDTHHEDSCFDAQTGPTAKQRANSEHQTIPVTTKPLMTNKGSPPVSPSTLPVRQLPNSPQNVHVESADVHQSSSLTSPPLQSDPDPVAIEKYGMQLRASHLASLKPSGHVHSLLVDYVMCLLQERDGLDRGVALPSWFCRLLSVNRAEDLRGEAVVDRLASGLAGHVLRALPRGSERDVQPHCGGLRRQHRQVLRLSSRGETRSRGIFRVCYERTEEVSRQGAICSRLFALQHSPL